MFKHLSPQKAVIVSYATCWSCTHVAVNLSQLYLALGTLQSVYLRFLRNEWNRVRVDSLV